MSAQPNVFLSEQDYLAGERTAETKYEYINGRVYAQAGASRNHNVIVTNTTIAFGVQLRNRQCTVFPSDLRVHIPQKRTFFYPDVTVVCGREKFSDAHHDTLLNPTVIVEVLSPSTENYDRGVKFERYRHIASLREYLLIAQNRVYIEHYTRQEDDQWLVKFFTDPTEIITLETIECTLLVSDVYLKVEFDSNEDDVGVRE